ncbi:bifunctional 2-polyprenyl-6-hydroxyphenol methylase/3-demethylubiquinol 3-O-methyltransferase UbiG [Variovorax sp. J22R115]|uniref:class I SAM-dependent methyltransferase n=1 Tax=Variovorax sp. J22R115 TaxID=3053509 RepID=UPI002574EFB8|nr:class I SAM-dependent methyltransferase [Variovorax sp. J22R115]MDM0048798.1 class I SAM-dependent methyltransferase [Variovorax sp. J22R115]
MPENHIPEVRRQYETLPYPPRDPEDERKRLISTWLESLPMINHYCFGGRQSFGQGFRALVAGGGTGDATIYLAEQLKHTDATIVHLDLSDASNAIARERARVRGLSNIEWIRDSILNLPSLGLSPFDYVNCSGVLHHLADPDQGLHALRHVLKPDGALGIMVYAAVGRTAIYQTQSLMRLINGAEEDPARKIAATRDILGSLPPGNWFRRSQDLHHDHRMGDAGIYDLFLHSQDRAYTAGEIFDWFQDDHGLHLEFTDVARGRSPYLPHMVLGRKPPDRIAELRAMPRRKQYEVAELLGGEIITHSFYATSDDRTAAYGDINAVPFYFHEPLTGEIVARVFNTNRGQPFILNHENARLSVRVNPGRYGAKLLGMIDGNLSFGEIFDHFRAGWHGQAAAPSNEALFDDLRESYETLNAVDRLLLRHPS